MTPEEESKQIANDIEKVCVEIANISKNMVDFAVDMCTQYGDILFDSDNLPILHTKKDSVIALILVENDVWCKLSNGGLILMSDLVYTDMALIIARLPQEIKYLTKGKAF